MPFNRRVLLESAYLLWMGLLPVISSMALGYFAFSNPAFFIGFTVFQSILFWGLAACIMGLAFCPTTFFAMFTGYIWGFPGLVPLIIAYAFASLLGFGLAKKMGGDTLLDLIKTKFKATKFLENVQASSFAWVFFARLSPVFPFAITNAIMAFVGVPFRQFFIAGTLGMLPRTVLALWTGSQAQTWTRLMEHPGLLRWQDFVSIFMLIISSLGMVYLAKRKA